MMRRLLLCLASAALVAAPSIVRAEYPDRPIRLILPLPTGSATDTVARLLAKSMEQSMKQPIVVENRAGGDGAIAAQLAAKAAPDGYTLFFGTNSPMSAVPALKKQPGYDPIKDFAPISLVGRYSQFLWVNASSPFHSLQDLLGYAKANPDKLSYATGNTGGIVGISQLLALAGRPKLVHVPYRGEPAALLDVVADRVQLILATPTAAGGYAADGKLRALATTLAERSPAYPNVPTMEEAGVPGFSITLWAGLFGPANLSPAIVDRLSKEVELALAQPELRQQLERQQFFPRSSKPEALRRFVQEQMEAYRTVLREAGVQPD